MNVVSLDDIEYARSRVASGVLSSKRVKAGIRAEELRERLDPEAAIVGLLTLANESQTCELEDLPRLKFQADIYKTILGKCMPDLKALEIKESSADSTTLVIDMVTE